MRLTCKQDGNPLHGQPRRKPPNCQKSIFIVAHTIQASRPFTETEARPVQNRTKLFYPCRTTRKNSLFASKTAVILIRQMDPVIGHVREYQKTLDATQKTKVAEKIIIAASDRIFLFLISHAPVDDAKDLRQSVFVAIVKGLDGFRGDSDGEFWSWCYRITRNIVAKHFGKKSEERTVSVDPEELARLIDASAQKEAVTSEERTILNDALALLKRAMPDCFLLLWKRYILGFEIKEIAAELGVAFDTARMKINRCLDSAQSLLEKS
jgi:RNA polymerase sigma factor (sigma-70 family)